MAPNNIPYPEFNDFRLELTKKVVSNREPVEGFTYLSMNDGPNCVKGTTWEFINADWVHFIPPNSNQALQLKLAKLSGESACIVAHNHKLRTINPLIFALQTS
jgi:hypothetical protein